MGYMKIPEKALYCDSFDQERGMILGVWLIKIINDRKYF
jgi:hypothetical protein